jgi:ribose transport system permease protein
VLGTGLVCGFINGTIVSSPAAADHHHAGHRRGLRHRAALRPVPGGDVDGDIGDFHDGQIFDVIPVSVLLLIVVVLVIWIPFRRSEIGRGCYAAGSAEGAAYMSGVKLGRSKLAAYVMSGFLAAVAGLLLTFITSSGEASAPSGGTTLNSIAAVVIGGTSLFGGSGTAIGSIFGAFVLRTISDLLFVFDLPPLWQPLFEGVVLLLAVCLGAARILRIRNRLEQFG